MNRFLLSNKQSSKVNALLISVIFLLSAIFTVNLFITSNLNQNSERDSVDSVPVSPDTPNTLNQFPSNSQDKLII